MDKQNIETLYPLAPLQQAFLWHSLQTSTQAGLLHMRCTLHGEVDTARLQEAWKYALRCYAVLRTSVHWESVKQPLQVVARQVSLPWTEFDWREREDFQQALADFLAADRDRGFDLTQAPITRLTLIRRTDTDYELIWSCHHLMLDGWSGALILNQVFDGYEALLHGQSPAPIAAPSYQAYIRWLKQQDEAAAADFWQAALAEFTTPTPLPVGIEEIETECGMRNAECGIHVSSSTHPPFYPSTHRLSLSHQTTADLQNVLRSHHLTLSTLVQGVWALLLYRYSGQNDVLFGATVSGRQGDLPGVEAIAGLLINVLPVRVRIEAKSAIADWLKALQTQQATASQYAYASPSQIQGWSDVQGRLFDSLLVVENYPIRAADTARTLRVDNLQSGIVSTYGLTVIVKPGKALTLMAIASEEQGLGQDALSSLLAEFRTVLEAIAEAPQQPLESLVSPCEQAVVGSSPAIAAAPVVASHLNRANLEGNFFAPSNSLELHLAQIWESVLGVHPLSVEASFFAMGGDSLLAVQLFNQMQQQLNCTLPLATLFQAPNVRQFAALLSQDEPVLQWSSLVPIQTNGSRPPLFFHGGSADALTWAEFSYQLGADQPFYALQRPDLDGSDVTHTTVESLATDCIKEMRMVQPTGPYVVGGHCFGGAVAFEIAQQLQAQGEDILSLVLIDAYCPASLPETHIVRLQTRLQLGLFWLRKNYYYHGGWAKLSTLPRKIWQRLQPSSQAPVQLIQNNENVHLATALPETSKPSASLTAYDDANNETDASTATAQPTVPYEYRYARAQDANEVAAARYLPRPYAGRIKLFRAEIQTLEWYFGPVLGWHTVAKDAVEVTRIPGFFGNLFNHQSGPLLAKQVKAYLAKIV